MANEISSRECLWLPFGDQGKQVASGGSFMSRLPFLRQGKTKQIARLGGRSIPLGVGDLSEGVLRTRERESFSLII